MDGQLLAILTSDSAGQLREVFHTVKLSHRGPGMMFIKSYTADLVYEGL